MKKEKESAAIGCIVGLCAMVSPPCEIVGSVLGKFQFFWRNNDSDMNGYRCGERRPESGRWERTPDKRGAEQGEGR